MEGWFVQSKTKDAKPSVFVEIFFQGGKLTQVRKDCTPSNQQEGVASIQRVTGLLAEFEQEGLHVCSIRTKQENLQGVLTFSGLITCGKKEIEMSVTTGHIPDESSKLAEFVNISEVLK